MSLFPSLQNHTQLKVILGKNNRSIVWVLVIYTKNKIALIFYLYKSIKVLQHLTKKLPLSLREFKKILPYTFIYVSILRKIYMNANIMNTQIFHFIKYDLKGRAGLKRSLLCLFYHQLTVLWTTFVLVFYISFWFHSKNSN